MVTRKQRKSRPGVDFNTRLFIALSLLAITAAGCSGNEPRPPARAGSPYVEEIKGPAPRDPLLFGPNCFVR